MEKELIKIEEFDRLNPREKIIAMEIEGAYASSLFQKIDQCAGENYKNCRNCRYAFRMLFTSGNSIACAKFYWHFPVPFDVSHLPPEPYCLWGSHPDCGLSPCKYKDTPKCPKRR